MATCAEGFAPLESNSPFNLWSGPFYVRYNVEQTTIATVSLNTEFVGTAGQGDRIEVLLDVQRTAGSRGFVNAYLVCEGERSAHASAVFKVLV